MSGYGVDVWCESRIVAGRLAYGWRVVAQACYRRLTTPRGALWFLVDDDATGTEEDAYGFDISAWLGAVGLEDAAASLPSLVSAELRKDPRVGEAQTEVSISGDTLRVSVAVTLADSSETFPLVLDVSEVSAALVRGDAQ